MYNNDFVAYQKVWSIDIMAVGTHQQCPVIGRHVYCLQVFSPYKSNFGLLFITSLLFFFFFYQSHSLSLSTCFTNRFFLNFGEVFDSILLPKSLLVRHPVLWLYTKIVLNFYSNFSSFIVKTYTARNLAKIAKKRLLFSLYAERKTEKTAFFNYLCHEEYYNLHVAADIILLFWFGFGFLV